MMSVLKFSLLMHIVIYKFDRLPFGVKEAQGIFPQAMDVMIGDMNFAIAYLDDILSKSETPKQRTKYIHEVF